MGGLKRVLENLRAQAGPDGPNLADIIEAQKIDVDQLRAWDELAVEDLKYIHEVRSARGESSPCGRGLFVFVTAAAEGHVPYVTRFVIQTDLLGAPRLLGLQPVRPTQARAQGAAQRARRS